MTDSVPPGSGGLMAGLNLMADSYERKARVYPALLLLLPVALVVVGGFGTEISQTEALSGLVISFGGLFLLAQIARDGGKSKQQMLFERWGGTPSVCIFRHRDTRMDPITKARCHKHMSRLVKEAKAPSVDHEGADPVGADRVYTAWSNYLRSNTRDTKQYSHLFRENVSFGYRRNVWGMRTIGIVTTATSLACSLSWLYFRYRFTGQIPIGLIIASVFTLILLLLWLFRFTADWVRIPADAYAERLAEAIHSLALKDTTK